ncbi:YidB family protein [Pseudolabrys sp. FHR47]|uniref:YidB family protein n=1 Tax=Pseudolabrys sp. FHR47 TaxID=2562284 RepID=UPI0010BE7C9A|nr:YidB family protein [Pseudolabrys sp. FHR47]
MGLLDVLNGMQNGPRGEREPGKGGMSPITMAILGLLAYKAVKSLSGGQTAPSTPSAPAPTQTSSGGPGRDLGGLLGGGGLGNVLAGGLGGLLAGGAAGSILSGGLNDLLKQFQQNGLGEEANSWVGTGPNKSVDPNDLAKALGADQLDALTNQTGMSRNELLEGLSQYLPQAVDTMTPDGRLPDEHEISRLL